MKIYTVYLKRDGDKTLQSAILVPEGFSWPALIPGYNIIWSIMNKCWPLLFILILMNITGFIQSELSPQWYWFSVYSKSIILYFMAVWANDFWRLSLHHRGYHMSGIVSGRNESEAQLRFFEEVTGPNHVNFHA